VVGLCGRLEAVEGGDAAPVGEEGQRGSDDVADLFCGAWVSVVRRRSRVGEGFQMNLG